MSLNSNAFDVTIEALPAWAPSPGNWASVSLNTMDDVGLGGVAPNGGSAWNSNNGYYNIWASAAYAPTLGTWGSIIVPADGGHNSYNGSDVYQYEIENRTWSRFKESVTGVLDSYSNSFGEFSDGTPLPPHPYATIEFTTFGADGGSLGSIFAPQTYTEFNQISPRSGYGHYLDLDTKNWVRGPDNANDDHNAAGAVDPDSGLYFYHGLSGQSHALKSWPMDASTAATTHNTASPGIGTDAVMAVDHVNNTLMVLDLRNVTEYRYWDLDNLGAGSTRVTLTSYAGGAGSGLAYVAETDRFYSIAKSDRSVWYLDATNLGGQFQQESDSGTRPPAAVNNLYKKLQWVEPLKCFIGCTTADSNVFAYRPVGT